MSGNGQDIIEVGLSRIRQPYVLGAVVPLDNPHWKGPWDCAEFASWCTYQAYGLIFGAGRAARVAKAEPYSGHWYSEAQTRGRVIAWKDALAVPGALLIRAPTAGRIGHVAISMGDHERTLEARGAAFGVGIFNKAAQRPWGIGCLLPGVDYETDGTLPPPKTRPRRGPKPKPDLPAGYLWLTTPNQKGAAIVALQRALAAVGIDPGPIDGEFGPMTHAAVVGFQIVKLLEVDGIVGPNTAATLGLAFPVHPSPNDEAIFAAAHRQTGSGPIRLPAAAGAFDGVIDINRNGRMFRARTASGLSFIVGSSTSYTDDMNRVGLFQGSTAITDSLRFGSYKAVDFAAAFGQWAHFIEPTLTAESGARFATINTYDRAAFTFGAPQLAAHTPEANFILYLRALLDLPDADKHFPELSLRTNASGRRTVHLANGHGPVDLEEVTVVLRPNGRREPQLARLMAYLNGSPTEVDANELSAAARLMNWLRTDAKAKELQIGVFIDGAKALLKTAKTKVSGFDGSDWRTALWIMDIRHQGRASYDELSAAMASAAPEKALRKLGLARFKERIRTVEAAVERMAASGVMTGFRV
ncbi:N-acetylmuramoyl-L-alanine amidase CwlH precursor [bacterium YEK0313]|nr:N-acetylmuramoyl-L-alanine amidase CwlH precursor [bacterium YEK0313]